MRPGVCCMMYDSWGVLHSAVGAKEAMSGDIWPSAVERGRVPIVMLIAEEVWWRAAPILAELPGCCHTILQH